jgi:hypothetical protein
MESTYSLKNKRKIVEIQEQAKGKESWIFTDISRAGISIIKAYDIRLHTLATNECQEPASKFEEKVKQSLAGVMKVYTDNVQDM